MISVRVIRSLFAPLRASVLTGVTGAWAIIFPTPHLSLPPTLSLSATDLTPHPSEPSFPVWLTYVSARAQACELVVVAVRACACVGF